MASWDEVRTHLRSTLRLERDDDDAVSFSTPVPVEGKEIVQRIGLARTTVRGRPWLAAVAELFPEAQLALRSAVLYQDRIAFGAIVIRRDWYVLRHGVLLDTLQIPDLEWTIRALVHEAVRLRANLHGGAPQGDAFGNYAE